jgi:restriction endonuclease S subunit
MFFLKIFLDDNFISMELRGGFVSTLILVFDYEKDHLKYGLVFRANLVFFAFSNCAVLTVPNKIYPILKYKQHR